METLLADLRQSARIMRKNPGFTVVAVTALALGIGANTAIFSVVDKVLLKPLPYRDANRIVRLGRKFANGVGYSNSIPKYMAWRHNTVFSAMALYDQQGPGLNLADGDRPEQIKGAHISKDYFKVFGAAPLLGRPFSAEEDAPHGPKAVILSENLWRSRFGSDSNILSRRLILNSESYAVVGVMPSSFEANPPAEAWIALQADPGSNNSGHYLAAAAKLKPGATIEQARAQMHVAGEAFRRTHPDQMDKAETVAVVPMQDSLVEDVRPALWILLGAVALVLLIACANVANLLLARAAGRQRELAIRCAVGASRWRVVRQLLTESVLLALCGGAAGFLVGIWGVRLLLRLVPGNIPLLTDPGQSHGVLSFLDWRVAVFTVGVSVLTGVLFGLFPALQISRTDVASTLKEASSRSGTGRHQNLVKKFLVMGEMSLALVLLVGALLLIRSFEGLSHAHAGIDAHNVLTFQTSLVGGKYNSTEANDTFIREVLRRLDHLPGVQVSAAAVALPTETQIDLPFVISGKPPKPGDQFNGDEQWRFVTPGYFAVFKIPLFRGRLLDERDTHNSAPVVLINRALAKKYWKTENPIGQVITIGKGLPNLDDVPRQIVGIVGDVRETSIQDTDVGVMYIPQSQVPEPLTALANSVMPLSWCIRSHIEQGTLASEAKREIQSVDAQMPIAKVQSMADVMGAQTSRQHFNMILLSSFAGIALILAAIGIYGLMSYAVEQQTQELGIRMALGADHPDLLRLIVKQGMAPALCGVVLGLAIAFGVTRLLATLLYGVKPADPVSFLSVAIVLACVALVSTYIPARRALKLDPTVALREE